MDTCMYLATHPVAPPFQTSGMESATMKGPNIRMRARMPAANAWTPKNESSMTHLPTNATTVNVLIRDVLRKDDEAILTASLFFFHSPHSSCSASSSVALIRSACASPRLLKASPMASPRSDRLESDILEISLVKMFTTPSIAEHTVEKFITSSRIVIGRMSCHPNRPSPWT